MSIIYPYKRNVGMKQYNLRKPVKYGLLLRSICDSSVEFCYFTLPCAGNEEYSKYLIEGLANENDVQGKNVSMERLFTSVSIARWRLEGGTSLFSTMRHDEKDIPKEVTSVAKTENLSRKTCVLC